ncbi:MAG: SDR family oxidoreductase [Candidatus Omnitrophica bacterium]|nr:SDR family oxidoreductase [Candidatus Omnitrophota bacterium]
MNITLRNKIILITGGTGGLGQALVETFLREKAQVLFTYYSHEERAKEWVKKGARGFRADFAERSSVTRLIDAIKKSASRLDGMIHNAGVTLDHTLVKAREEEFDRSLEINLTAVFLISRGLLTLLEKSKCPKILNVSSRVGLRGNFGQTAYSASKAALMALTKSMAIEWGASGICANAITPGYLMTDMTRGLPREVHQKMREESTLHQISDPQEVANFAAYLMSDRVSRVSGQIFHYDTRKT